MGIILIRQVTSLPYKVGFSWGLLISLGIGFIIILFARWITSRLLYSRLKTTQKRTFVGTFLLALHILFFSGGQSSLHSFINRFGQNVIVSDIEIIVEDSIPDGINPRETIKISDNFLRNPSGSVKTYQWDKIEKRYESEANTYIWDLYRDYWVKKVSVSTILFKNIIFDSEINWQMTNFVYEGNESVYKISFYIDSVFHENDDEIIVYADKNGTVIGTATILWK